MNTPWNGGVETQRRHEQLGLEAVELAAVAVAPHGDVDRAEAALVGASVEHLGGEQDHPGARAEHRHPVGESQRRSGRTARCVTSSRDIVVLSPPGMTSASTPARSAGVRT